SIALLIWSQKLSRDEVQSKDSAAYNDKAVEELVRLNVGVESQNNILTGNFSLIGKAIEVIYHELKDDSKIKSALETVVVEIKQSNHALQEELRRLSQEIQRLKES
ncbi:MAG: hypothetical protein RMM53_05730, partial [Bacteroidia bacterium]|nr:hypothetical protein [Bacteroidia bacterium]